jgi:predicted transcriptional regulator
MAFRHSDPRTAHHHKACHRQPFDQFGVSVFKALKEAGSGKDAAKHDPAVPVGKSVFRDHIVCLECGNRFSTLKRHIRTEHGLTPEEYRQRFGLGLLYPLVAADYAERRSAMAKQLGLGRKRAADGAAPRKAQSTNRGRPKKSA